MKTKKEKNNDEVLFLALKKSNKKAFTLLYEKYWEKLYYIAYQHTQSTQESEDLIHEVFIDLWNNRKKIKIKKTLSSYIFTALKFKIFRLYDKKSVRKKYFDRIKQNDTGSLNVTEMELSFNELFDLIEHEIDKLPERCKLIFKMRRLDDYSIEEVAKKLEISTNTVNNQMTKASKILKVKIGEYLNSTFF
jgi:RNA polymerase sigma-70 factor (ECF subfamily)